MKTRNHCLLIVLTVLAGAPGAWAGRPTLSGHVPPEVAELRLRPIGRMPGTNRLHFAINLPLRNDEQLNLLLRQVYDPTSTNFHHYLTPEQFREQFGPSPDDYEAVAKFAQANGLTVTRRHPGRAVMGLDASVADIEKALHVKMLLYQHPTEGRQFYAPDAEPSLDLSVPVEAISGLNNYMVSRPISQRSPMTPITPSRPITPSPPGKPLAGTGTNGYFIGSDFRNAYAPGVTLTGVGQTLGLVESAAAGGYNPGDIQLYEKLAGLPNVPLVSVFTNDAYGVPGTANTEYSVDIEMAIAMAPGLSSVVLYERDGIVTDEETYQEMAYPTYGETRPNQISTSWSMDVSPASTNYLRELVVQGQSFFYASGDGGALVGRTADWPAFNYTTIVGGTSLTMSGFGQGWKSEQVWGSGGPTGSPYGSAGGLLTGVHIPFYQVGVDMSFNQGSTLYRNVPDVAMPASSIEVVDSYQPTNGPRQTELVGVIGGTSCASPLWAGFAALVNQQAEAEGKPPAGFLNPAIYAIGEGPNYTNCFHDITVGNNSWSNSPTAYYATNGYDLCTGWGSPVGASLINALIDFTGPVFVNLNYTGTSIDGSFDHPYKTFAQGSNAVSVGGTIFFLNGGSSPQPTTITKPMTISAENGPVSIGN
jgi:subtilase family serine protease